MLAIEIADKLYRGKLPRDIPMESRLFQDKAVEKLNKHSRHILGLPMGSGKTVVAVRALKNWAPSRSLIIPTERAILGWLKVMWLWFPEELEKYAIIGKNYTKHERIKFYNEHAKHPRLSVISNWHLLTRDSDNMPPLHFDVIMTDEHHKFMRNRNTKAHKMLATHFRSDKILMLTGSPASKGAQDFYATLNVLDPKLFKSYWKFVSTWCNVSETPHGKDVWGTRNEEAFKRMLFSYAIIATKKQLGLQKKVRDVIRVQMDALQQRAYDQIRDEFLLELEDAPPVVMLNTLSQYIKLRQVTSCPAILNPQLGIGGGAKHIQDTLLDLSVPERHSVIFTPFKLGLPYLKAFYEGRGKEVGLPASDNGVSLGIPVYTFSGGMGLDNLFEGLYNFKKYGGLAICTTQFAESFDMETTDKAFMLGFDWDPQINYQAEDRIDRLNNPHGLINIYYLLHEGSLDEDILYSLAYKQENVHKLFSQTHRLIEALR
jgi:SNF2 family DNA or RNA helicase